MHIEIGNIKNIQEFNLLFNSLIFIKSLMVVFLIIMSPMGR